MTWHDTAARAALILHEHERRDREEQELQIALLGRRLDHAHYALRQLSTLLLGRYAEPPPLPVPPPPALEVMARPEAEEAPVQEVEAAAPAPAPQARPVRPVAPPPAPIRAPDVEAQDSPSLVLDPGPTVAVRRPVILALDSVAAAEGCRGWPGYAGHSATLDPVIASVVDPLREIEQAEQRGDVHALRELRARKVTQARSGVAARCQAALDRLLSIPSAVVSPTVLPAAELGGVSEAEVEPSEEAPPELVPMDLDAIDCPA
jgi:hypothetical protein